MRGGEHSRVLLLFVAFFCCFLLFFAACRCASRLEDAPCPPHTRGGKQGGEGAVVALAQNFTLSRPENAWIVRSKR